MHFTQWIEQQREIFAFFNVKLTCWPFDTKQLATKQTRITIFTAPKICHILWRGNSLPRVGINTYILWRRIVNRIGIAFTKNNTDLHQHCVIPVKHWMVTWCIHLTTSPLRRAQSETNAHRHGHWEPNLTFESLIPNWTLVLHFRPLIVIHPKITPNL